MRVIAIKILKEFWEKHADSEEQLRTWYKEASKAKWSTLTDIKNEYPKVSILKAGRVVFNICGNRNPLITHVNYIRHWVFIRFIGTHSEYHNVDTENV